MLHTHNRRNAHRISGPVFIYRCMCFPAVSEDCLPPPAPELHPIQFSLLRMFPYGTLRRVKPIWHLVNYL
ncbi:Hypothetical protein SMAX5B_019941 [Scophthalmus maximus]|uniref:Uncharacterized protein n=1 Tax=Scophthalmus maximus TaxID=52904 RepID=A0A2U9B3Y1_SCOMX|nr:Hypothetical protein SMAX5B_019941 [Scophthalmus maximus]